MPQSDDFLFFDRVRLRRDIGFSLGEIWHCNLRDRRAIAFRT